MTDRERGSAEPRNVFGSNLRKLARDYPSVSALCRQLGINRTQFNRYLSGESYPRPDVLDQICRFFEVDARILLKPLEKIATERNAPVFDTFGHIKCPDAQAELRDGFYRVETANTTARVARLMFVRSVGPCILLRCYTPPNAPHAPKFAREIRGFATHNGNNTYALLARRGGQDHQMLVLSADEYGRPNLSGHLVTLAEFSVNERVSNAISLHFIGKDWRSARQVLRNTSERPVTSDAENTADPKVATH